MSRFYNSLLIAVAVGSLQFAGCVTRGREFPSQTDWIKVNKTTKQDVERLLGEPYSVGRNQDNAQWTYGYYKHRIIGESRTKELRFWWNENGTVESFSFNSSFPDDKQVGKAIK
jgi:outer membrane protein assembly factor BamE (lipoprotein component of BamABCDE complex)